MPKEIGVCKFNNGTYEVYPDLANVAPSTKYIRDDVIDALVKTLEFYAAPENYGHCSQNNAVCWECGELAKQTLFEYNKSITTKND